MFVLKIRGDKLLTGQEETAKYEASVDGQNLVQSSLFKNKATEAQTLMAQRAN